MLKKLVIGGAIVATLGALVAFGGRPFSYARTWVASWKQNAEDNVPLDLKIKHAKEEVAQLGPEIRKCMHLITEQQVELEDLQDRIKKHRVEVKKQELAIKRMRDDLKTGESSYVYAGQTYRASEVRKDLAMRFDHFRAAEESLKREVQILEAKKKALKANERRLEEMLAAKKQLEVQIAQLEARHRTLESAKASSEIEFDDSHLARTKTLIRKIEKELDVQTKLLAAEGKLTGNIPVNEKPASIPVTDVTKDIDEYFAKRDGGRIKVVKTNGSPAKDAKKPAETDL